MKRLFPFLFLLAFNLNAAPPIDPDVEIRVNGMVCSSCAVGLKKIFTKDSRVKVLKMDVKKQIVLPSNIGIQKSTPPK